MFKWLKDLYLNFKADQLLLPSGQINFYSDFIIIGSTNINNSQYEENDIERKYILGVKELKREVLKNGSTDEEIRNFLRTLNGEKDMLSLIKTESSFVDYIRKSLVKNLEKVSKKKEEKEFIDKRIKHLHYGIDMREIRQLNRQLRAAKREGDIDKVKELTEVINGKRKQIRKP